MRTVSAPCCLLLGLMACGGDAPVPAIDVSRPECENLNPGSCMAPYPSSRYLVDDSDTSTGRRIEIPPEAMLRDRMGNGVDPAPYNRFDGFSVHTPIATVVDGGALDTSVLASETDIARSLAPDSPTVLLDADTGERVAHIAEIDEWPGGDPAQTTLYLRPIRPLAEDHRYVVAIRALTYEDGAPVPPSSYFAALRDGTTTSTDELEARRATFDEVFAILADAGIERATLIEAWDFRTGTLDGIRRDLLAMRDDALSRIGERGTTCTVETSEEDFGSSVIYRRFSGTFEVPLYAESEEPGARIVRGADGLPEFQGMGQARFVAIVPVSAAEAAGPVPVAIFGHGLLGEAPNLSVDEGEGGIGLEHPISTVFEEMGMAAIGTDYWGLSHLDITTLFEEVDDLSRLVEIPERLMQAMVNFITLSRNMKGDCGELAEWNVGGVRKIDTTDLRYLGVSGGAVNGSVFAALTPDIGRFAFVIGGTHWPTLISRSFAFAGFNLVLNSTYTDKRGRDILLAMSAHLWDLADGATFAPLILNEPLPGSPDKQLLLQTVLNDSYVNNLSSDYLARVAGLSHVTPSPYEPYEVPTTAYGDGLRSGQVMYDMGADPLLPGTRLPPDNGTHTNAIALTALREQLSSYLHDGTITSFCDGVCDPD